MSKAAGANAVVEFVSVQLDVSGISGSSAAHYCTGTLGRTERQLSKKKKEVLATNLALLHSCTPEY